MLKDKGFQTFCVPEAATIIFASGGILDMENYSDYQAMLFQKSLMQLQIALERRFVDIACIKP